MDENTYNALVILTKALSSVLSFGPHGDDLQRVQRLDRELSAMTKTDLGVAKTRPSRASKQADMTSED